jgi:cell division protein FtsW
VQAGTGILKTSKGDRGIWVFTLLLSIFSLLAVYSSTLTLAYKMQKGHTEFYLIKQAMFLVAGLVIIYLAHLIHYKWYALVAKWLFYISIPLLIYTYFFGTKLNEGSRWVTLPVINLTIQSSDIAKLALFMYLSLQLSKRQETIKSFRQGYWPLLWPVLLICGLIAPANLSTALLLGASCMLLMFFGRVSFTHLGITLLILVIIPLVSLLMLAKYAQNNPDSKVIIALKGKARMATWLKRVQDFAYTSNTEDQFQVNLSKMAIAEGGIIGKAPGNSELKNFLPHPYSDFIYAIIIEEYGLLGGLVVMLVYLGILFRSIKIFQKCPYAFGGFLCLGISFLLAIQAFANMAVAVNLFPVTGVTLPLVSMGGTSLLFSCLAIGIILSVSRHIDNEKNSKEQISEA